MNTKLNFLSKHKENRPFCAKALLLAVALWFACAAGSLAQGMTEYALIISVPGGVSGGADIYTINLEIVGNEKSEVINDASGLVSACSRQTITEDILYKLDKDIVASQSFTVNKCLKLDLNGHSITSSATKCFNINDNAGLTIVDSSTDEQKGSINCTYNDDSDAIYINSGAKFIADGVTITCAKGSAITNVSGTAKISGCTIKDYSVSGIKNAGGTVTLNDWPTFSAASAEGVSDIWLHQGNTITIGSAITAAPTKEISVRVTDNNDNDLTADALPATFTSGYAEKVKSDATTVIDPAEVFTYYKSDAYHIVTLDAATSSEAVLAAIPMEVTYIDPTKPVGQQECTANAYILDGTETKLGSNGQTTWYVCTTPATDNDGAGLTYTQKLTLLGNVNLILADDCKMSVGTASSPLSDHAIYQGSGNFTIYGQTDGSGTLAAYGGDTGISCNGANFTINGGTVDVNASSTGIQSTSTSVTINDGKVSVVGGTTNGIFITNNSFAITGGKVSAIGGNDGIVSAMGSVTLGWRHPDDYIYASSYKCASNTLFTAAGQRFVSYDLQIEQGAEGFDPALTKTTASVVIGSATATSPVSVPPRLLPN